MVKVAWRAPRASGRGLGERSISLSVRPMDAEPGSSGAAVGTAATGRRSSLAAAKQLDAALNAAGAEPEPEPEPQQKRSVQPGAASFT